MNFRHIIQRLPSRCGYISVQINHFPLALDAERSDIAERLQNHVRRLRAHDADIEHHALQVLVPEDYLHAVNPICRKEE